MLVASQKVVVDSIKKTTLLDKKATIAQGNISKQRDSLIKVNNDQQRLIDSLRKESLTFKKEADSLRKSFNNLSYALKEKTLQLAAKEENMVYAERIFKSDIKALRRKRLGLGASVGYGITEQGQSPFVGLSLNYTLIRF